MSVQPVEGAEAQAPRRKGRSLAKKFAENFDSDSEEEIEEESVPFGRRVSTLCTHIVYMAKTFIVLNGKDISRRKGSYCLGVFSTMLVVLITCLMLTVLSNMPILFLRLGEADEGEMDLIITPGGEASQAPTLNYSKIKSYFPSPGDRSYHTPRMAWGNAEAFNRNKCTGAPSTGDVLNTSFLWDPVTPGGACSEYQGCPEARCGSGAGLMTVFYDHAREERMGLGTSYQGKVPQGAECVISKQLSVELGAAIGDIVLVHQTDTVGSLLQAYQTSNLDQYDPFTAIPNGKYTKYPTTIFALKVIDIVSNSGRKMPTGVKGFMMVDYASMSQVVAAGLSPKINAEQRAAFAAVDPEVLAGEVIFNMPASTRVDNYAQSDVAKVQNAAIKFASPIISRIGFNQITIAMPLVEFFYEQRFFSLFLGLILSMIITGLSALSIILIYSLLIVGIETKTFELAVMRMVGMTRLNLVFYVLTSASAFAIPAWVFGLVLGQLFFLIIRQSLNRTLAIDLPPGLSADAIGYATLAGIGIPLISSFAPMSTVLSQDLPTALDTNRNKVQTIKYEIERHGVLHVDWLLVGFGVALVVFGFLIYYLFPLALLTFNITLLFYIFFGLLLGMLFGFVLLAVNMERIIETMVQYTFFFWESDANFTLIEKNMTAHRRRNRKTTLMYSMALGFIIFITVAFQIQLQSVEFSIRRQMGGELTISRSSGAWWSSDYMTYDQAVAIDEILNRPEIQAKMKSYTWRSTDQKNQYTVANNSMMTIGRLVDGTARIVALSPNFYEVVDTAFLKVRSQENDNGFNLAEQLYSLSGSGKALTGATYAKTMAINNLDERFVIEVKTENVNNSQKWRRVASPQAILELSPVLWYSKFPQFTNQNLGVSAPTYIRRSFSLQSFKEVGFKSFNIRCNKGDSDDLETLIGVQMAVHPALGPGADVSTTNYYDEIASLKTARTVVNVFFIFTQVMSMVISFFSLMSSMAANIHEQAKEIGVLRAIGMKCFPLKRVYVEEAFCIVVSSSLMGIIVGVGVAYTMMLQRVLFTQLPLPFVFPWIQLVVVVGVALFGGFVSSYGPISALLNSPSIPHILRRTT